MTTDNGSNGLPDPSESDIIRTIGELPDEVLAGLQRMPASFLNRLADLSPEAIEQLSRLPVDMLGQLSDLPDSVLEWLGRASARNEAGLNAEVMAQLVRMTGETSEPLRTLKAIPSSMLKVMSALPADVFNSLMALPPQLLKQLPDALAATSETLDEIPTNLSDLSQGESESVDVDPELIATLGEMPPGAVQTIAELPSDSLATIAELDPQILDTIRELPSDLLETISEIPPGALSTVIEMPIGASTTLSELDPEVLARLAADETPEDTGEAAPTVPSALIVRLGRADDGSGRILGRLLSEARSIKDVIGEPDSSDDDSSVVSPGTVSEMPSDFGRAGEFTLPPSGQDSADQEPSGVDEEGETSHDDNLAGEGASTDESDDAGATVPDIESAMANAGQQPQTPDDSFEEASITDAWAEGLSALETGEGRPVDRSMMESGDFSQSIDPEGISENDDSYGETMQSDEWDQASVDDASATQRLDDNIDDSDDGYGATVQSEDISAAIGGGLGNDQDDAGRTVPDSMAEGDSEDSFGETMQSDEGWSAEGLSAFDRSEDGDESYSQAVQPEALDDPNATIQDASVEDDSYGATIQSDEGWSADGLSALDAPSADSNDEEDESFAQTVQSDEWSRADDDDESYSQTVVTDDSFESPAENFDSDDSYGATIQSDPSVVEGHTDDSFAATIQSGDIGGDDAFNEDDSYGATLQSDEHTEDKSFAQTIATSDLTDEEQRTMADAWGPGFDEGDERPDMTIKSDDLQQQSPKHTLVISERKLSTRKIKDYNKGHSRPAEPNEPEYELLKKLGEGGMGLVFNARQRSIDREVALKMLKPKTARDAEQRAKFLTEAVVTGELDHPNIVPIYDVGASSDDALFYAMKKVEGTPWLDVIKEKSLEDNLEILRRTADAVGFAHSRGVVHRDLKPENVMLGAFNEVLVMDWGLAYSTEGFRKSNSITESTSMGGTPAYMAPEMATGPITKIGAHSDVYLLGAILFEIVTGKPPHAGRNAMKCLMAAARNQIRDSDNERTRRNDPTGELLKIARKAMESKPKDRYQTVDELQAAIRDYQSHTESITLTLRALEDLREAKKNKDYDTFSRARFGYEEALNLWGNNKHAQKGLQDTRLEYALCAQDKGDFDLGMSLLDVALPAHKALYDELLDAKNTVLARERQLEEQKAARARMRRIMTVGTVAALIMMSGLAGWAFLEREEAVRQEQIATANAEEAKRQEGIAKDNEKEAVRQKGLAEENEKEALRQKGLAEEQKLLAEKNAEEALRQKGIAEKNETEARKQQMLAEANAKEALRQKGIAEEQTVIAKKNFAEAEKQRKIAVTNETLAKKNEMLAKKNEAEAVKQKGIAEKNAEEARKQEKIALANAKEALKQKGIAEVNADKARKNAAEALKQQMIAEANAKEALRQKGIADNQRLIAEQKRQEAEQAREAEEYQAYIARIGLADAKIRENAFDTALTILNDCPPRLRNWEWGRLMHLCTQSIGTFNNDAPVDAIAIAPDGSKFVTGGWNGRATIWEMESGRPLSELEHDGLYVYSVDWSNDGKWIATGSNDVANGYVQVWNVETGERADWNFGDNKSESTSHTDAVLSVHFSKGEGTLKLLTASYDNTARLWNAGTGEQIRRFLGHTWWVWDARFSADEKKIVTASQDGTAIVWDADTGEPGAPFTGHEGPIYSADFSPDGVHVATGGYDRRVLLWRPSDVRPYDFSRLTSKSGSVVPPARFVALDGHEGPVRAVAFSDDGTQITSGSQDNTVRLWNAESGQLVKSFRGHDGAVRAVAFADSDQMIVSGSHDNRIRKWDVREYEEIRVLQGQVLEGHVDAILSAGFSPDGNSIVTASRDRTARTWETLSGQPLRVFSEGHSFLATSAVFFPGGRRLATGAVDNTVRIWDVDSGTQMQMLDHTGRAAALAVSSDGKWLVTGSDDQTAKVWDTDSGKLKTVLKGHRNEVTAVAISEDGSKILTGDSRGRVILWDLQNESVLFELSGHSRSRVTAAAFLPGTTRGLTASADRTVAQWDLTTGKEVPELILKHPDSVMSMAVRPGTRQILTACHDGNARLWDADNARIIATLDRGDSKINGVAFDEAGQKGLAVDSNGRKVHIWSMASVGETITPERIYEPSGQLWSAIFAPEHEDLAVLTLGGSDARLVALKSERRDSDETLVSFSPHGIVASASFSPDGSRIVTGSWDFSARIWDAATGSDLKKLAGDDGHTGFVNSAVFSPDAEGRWVLTASDDGTAKIWDASTGVVLATLTGHEDRVRFAAFSRDGKRVLTSSNDRTARVWDLTEGATPDGSLKVAVQAAQVFQGHEWAVLSAEFSDDGQFVITASEDNTARIWSIETGEQIASLAGHTARVTSAAFAPGDSPTRAVTASQDGTVKLWDTQTQKEILTLDGHTREVTSVTFSPDGKYVLTASQDGRAILWLTAPWQTANDENLTMAAGRGPQAALVP